MKALLAIPADRVFLIFARIYCKLYRLRMKERRAAPPLFGHVILAPSTRGNLGDEAMLTASIGEIRQRADCEVTLLTHSDSDDWSDIASGIKQVSIEGYFSAFRFQRGIFALLRVLSGAKSFSILGADIMDGAYSRSRSLRRIAMLELAAAVGTSARVLGFSYSDRHNPFTHRYLLTTSEKATLYLRDAKSFLRLKDVAQGNVVATADTAFLLEKANTPSPTALAALQFIDKMNASGNRIIAFNANPLGSSMSSGAISASSKVDDLDELIGRHLHAILDECPSCCLVLIPHDPREPHNDRSLLQRAYETLPRKHRERVFCAFDNITARDVKLICSQVDFAVTGRMHMGIAALGVGCPTAFLDFQGKVQGLLEHFGVPDLVFDWDVYRCSKRFAEFVRQKLDRAEIYRAKIKGEHDAVIALARLNFSEFGEG